MKALRWLWLLLLVPVALGLGRLRFDTEVLHLLPDDVPEVRGLRIWQDHFSAAGDLLVTIASDDAGFNARIASNITARLRVATNEIAGAQWQAPWREHPGAVSELVAARWLNQPPAVITALADRLAPDRVAEGLAERREQLAFSLSPDELARFSYDPLGLLELPGSDGGAASVFGDEGPFASPDGTFRVVHVQPAKMPRDHREAEEWMNSVRDAVDQELAPETSPPRIGFTGGPAFPAEIGRHMETDMKRSVIGTALVVGLLFGLVHRRVRPLLWLVTLGGLILLLTVAAGGLILGQLNVVSLGFAAILLGLVVDYGLVLYQERIANPARDRREVCREVAPGIWSSALTTAGAFALLNFAGLPGLAQLGTLVAVGILIGAAVILAMFLVPLDRITGEQRSSRSFRAGTAPNFPPAICSFVVLVVAGAVVWLKPPAIDATSAPLRLADSPAYETLDELRDAIGGEESWSLLVLGDDEGDVSATLLRMNERLEELRAAGRIESSFLPVDLVPSPGRQQTNRVILRRTVDQRTAILAAASSAGFTEESLRLANAVFDTWEHALANDALFWPENPVSRWVLDRSLVRNPSGIVAAGVIQPAVADLNPRWATALQSDRVMIASWERLGPALLENVEHRLRWVLGAIVVGVGVALLLTFRDAREAALCIGALAAGGVMLQAVMSLAGWSWNLMNLMAVPLLIGATVDYSIHMQLSLRRHDGDPAAAFHATGRALLLCAATTATGFGTLGFSRNAGLASLGQACAAGALCAAVVACFFLPAWWRAVVKTSSTNTLPAGALDGGAGDRPSRFYDGRLWRCGMWLAVRLPAGIMRALASGACRLYAMMAPARRRVVESNLLPVVNGDLREARRLSRRLFYHFGVKIADLLACEGGRSVSGCFKPLPETWLANLRRNDRRGALLLTVHLGNWEFGAPILIERGVKLLVISQAEPGEGFTELRQRARARWGIETLIVSGDAFAFVEVLKRLQAGEVVALLMDRPPAASAVEVELFGRPFRASVSAAELARASGCALLPVVIPWTPAGYEIVCLDEIEYERVALGTRAARVALTAEILRAFEPVIRKHAGQWFHFVPVWKG